LILAPVGAEGIDEGILCNYGFHVVCEGINCPCNPRLRMG
jgi:hypothetical protein